MCFKILITIVKTTPGYFFKALLTIKSIFVQIFNLVIESLVFTGLDVPHSTWKDNNTNALLYNYLVTFRRTIARHSKEVMWISWKPQNSYRLCWFLVIILCSQCFCPFGLLCILKR